MRDEMSASRFGTPFAIEEVEATIPRKQEGRTLQANNVNSNKNGGKENDFSKKESELLVTVDLQRLL